MKEITFIYTDNRPMKFFLSVPCITYYYHNGTSNTLCTFSHPNADLFKIALSQYDNEYELFCEESTAYQTLIGNMAY